MSACSYKRAEEMKRVLFSKWRKKQNIFQAERRGEDEGPLALPQAKMLR